MSRCYQAKIGPEDVRVKMVVPAAPARTEIASIRDPGSVRKDPSAPQLGQVYRQTADAQEWLSTQCGMTQDRFTSLATCEEMFLFSCAAVHGNIPKASCQTPVWVNGHSNIDKYLYGLTEKIFQKVIGDQDEVENKYQIEN